MRYLGLVLTFWLLSDSVSAVLAHADDAAGFVGSNNARVDVAVNVVRSTEGGTRKAVRTRTASRTCVFAGSTISCSGPHGTWSSARNCYIKPIPASQMSPTARKEPGQTASLLCTSVMGYEMYNFWDFPAQAAADPPPPPDPQVLARQAVASMQLAPVDLGMHPKPASQQGDALGYVGWNQWMWVSNERDNTMGPISRTASLNGYSVTATAEVDRVVWDMGDGGSVSCGAGTPWRSSVADNQPSPDCGHVYEKDGEFTVTATSYWTVTWSGIGETGSFGMELSNSENHTVAEVQVVNVTGG